MKCFSCNDASTCDPPEGGIFNSIECSGVCFTQYIQDDDESPDEFQIIQRGCYTKGDIDLSKDAVCNQHYLIGKRLCHLYCDTDECNSQDNDPTIVPFQQIASLFDSPVFYGFIVFFLITVCILVTYLACTRSLPCCSDEYDDESRSSAYGGYPMNY